MDALTHGFINVVEEGEHGGELSKEMVVRYTENFAKPVVFRNMVEIDPKLSTREFYEVELGKTLQWRRKQGSEAASFRSKDGKADYNYVSGKVGTGAEFLDDIFVHRLDVYSHLGTISSGFKDPHEWGKIAFNRMKEKVFETGWLNIDTWRRTGHMFFGYSSQKFGEPMNGAVGSDWHMFPTLNIFVMIAGRKKWMTRPPAPEEQLGGYSRMFPTSSGREAPGADFDHDTVYLHPGDVLVNMPFEWHKVLNDEGLSLGGAFRIIDTQYIRSLAQRPSIAENMPTREDDIPEELAHLLTSVSYASLNLRRAQMMLNDVEYAYLALQALQKRRREEKMAAA